MRTKVTVKGVRRRGRDILRIITGFTPKKTEENKSQLAMLWTENLAPVLGQKPSKETVTSL
jgi:hypothetical protein